MTHIIRTLVVPAAGLGKRLYPLTRTIPKALIQVRGKPLLTYALEEASSSGIREVILVVNPAQKSIFRRYLASVRRGFPRLSFHVRTQEFPSGNGHAILQAADVVGHRPFAVRFCDDLLLDTPPVLEQLLTIFDVCRTPVILLMRVSRRFVSRFGVVDVRRARNTLPAGIKGTLYSITDIVEKPTIARAPSNLTIVGGYALTPQILRNLRRVVASLSSRPSQDAVPIGVALQIELIAGGRVYGWEFPGMRADCGTLSALEKAGRVIDVFARGRMRSQS